MRGLDPRIHPLRKKLFARWMDCKKSTDIGYRLDEENSERFYAAEIYRLLGETYLRSRQELDQAERYLCKGLKVAREQKAKSLELRLCASIYDLHDVRQNADKYRPQLGQIYRSFSEGFDTADLVRAKARLKSA